MDVNELKGRDYNGGVSQEVCNAIYDTIRREKYSRCLCACEDENVIDWMTLTGADIEGPVIQDRSTGKRLDFAFIDNDIMQEDIPIVAARMKKKGQIAFHGISPGRLRAFFNTTKNYDNWMTIEIQLGDGMFIARRI